MSKAKEKTGEMERELTVVEGGQKPILDLDSQTEEVEIDLLDLAYTLFDKLHIIVLAVMIGALLLNAYSYFMIHPTYQSTSKMYIVSSSKDSVVDISDLNIGTTLTKDYEQLLLSYPVLDEVIETLHMKTDSEGLAQMISITNPADTRILNITVTSTDPEEAMNIANTLAKVAAKYLPKTMSTNAPNIAQKARLADHKSGPSYMRYTMIGALLGLLASCGFFTVKYILDDTIHTPEDMERYFGIVPLTTIPENDMINKDRNKRRKGRR